MRLPLACFALLALSAQCTGFLRAAGPAFRPRAEHVVIVVWDGMRPDFITPEAAPTLHALAQAGTRFADHHSVYITSTEVNGAAIATGCWPGHNGILANREYRPEVDRLKPFPTENSMAMQRMDALRGGKYLRVATLAEIVQRAGFHTAVAGTKPVALLHDRNPDRSATHSSAVLFAGKSYPPEVAQQLAASLGAFPDLPPAGTLAPNTAQNAWTTKALVDGLWKDGVPKFSTLWLGDPDFSQHLTQPGAAVALKAIRDSDTNLDTLLAALEARGVREKTDIFVVSDHGFSTAARGVDLGAALRSAGFTVAGEYPQPPQPGEVLMIGLGGTIQLYVPGHDAPLIRRLVEFLQTTEFCGPIFTHEALPGTFTLEQVFLASPDSADIVFALRWTDEKNRAGIAGALTVDGRRTGYGTHASLSPFDVHNTLVAAGPDIRAGFVDQLPTANIDLAPTVLTLLGLNPPEPLDGRVVAEALPGFSPAPGTPETKLLEAMTSVGGLRWRQYLKVTTLDGHTYLDEANARHEAETSPAPPPTK